MVEILVPLGSFAMIVAIVYLVVRKKERMTLIQHGADASSLKMDKESNGALKFGLLLIGVSVGILLGNIISETTYMQEEVAYFSMTLICGGISLLIYYFISKQQAKKEKDEQQ